MGAPIEGARHPSDALEQQNRIESAAETDNWIKEMIKEILWTQTSCPLVPFLLNQSERKMVNNLINAAWLGKNMHFSSIARIQSPHQDQMGDLSSISIMKRQQRMKSIPQNSETEIGSGSGSGKQYVQIAHILANGQVCIANEKLPRKLPDQMVYAKRFID